MLRLRTPRMLGAALLGLACGVLPQINWADASGLPALSIQRSDLRSGYRMSVAAYGVRNPDFVPYGPASGGAPYDASSARSSYTRTFKREIVMGGREVTSTVSAYGSVSAARQAFLHARSAIAAWRKLYTVGVVPPVHKVGVWHPLTARTVGNESAAWYAQYYYPDGVDTVTQVLFRHGSYLASVRVLVSHALQPLLPSAVALARLVEGRIARSG